VVGADDPAHDQDAARRAGQERGRESLVVEDRVRIAQPVLDVADDRHSRIPVGERAIEPETVEIVLPDGVDVAPGGLRIGVDASHAQAGPHAGGRRGEGGRPAADHHDVMTHGFSRR
jgi:hypothetical protein